MREHVMMSNRGLLWLLLCGACASEAGSPAPGDNAPPTLGSPTATTAEDTAGTIDLLAGARDPDGDPLRVSRVFARGGHTVELVGSTATVTPVKDFAGEIRIDLEVSDGRYTVPGVASLTVTPVNDPPVASNDSLEIHGPATVMLAASDVDDAALTYEVIAAPAHGTLTGTAPALRFEPAAGYVGADQLTYRVSDGKATADATIALHLGPGPAPIARSQTRSSAEDQALDLTLVGEDPEGRALSFTVLTQPAHGTLTGTAPRLRYTPSANFAGDDAFTFAVDNGTTTSDAATVALHITPVNDVPIAVAATVQATEDTAKAIHLTGVDVEGSALSFLVGQPAHGTLTGTGADRTYQPAPDFHGPDSFTFTVFDGQVGSQPATIAIDVVGVDDPPIAVASAATVAEDGSVQVTITGSDADGDAVSLEIAGQPAHGALTGTPPVLTYKPAADFHGADAFTFAAVSGGARSAPATVSLTVLAVNDAPVASPGGVTTAEDTAIAIPLVGSDVDGDPLTFSILEAPSDGTLTGSGASRLYTPAANASGFRALRFDVFDGHVHASATVTIEITPVNDAPAVADDFVATDPGTALAIDVLRNDTDAEGDPVALDAAAAPAHGEIEIVDGKLVYTPAAGFTGIELVSYTASDGHGGTATAQIHIGVGTFPPGAPTESIAALGAAAPQSLTSAPAISGDGRILAIVTTTALVADDTDLALDVYVFDRGTRTLTRISGAADDRGKLRPRLSFDGRYVVYESDSANLVAGDSNGVTDVFRFDRRTGETIRISVASDGTGGNAASSNATISDDGNLVAFASNAFNLVGNDANGARDVFVRDVAAGTTTRVSVTAAGGEADLASNVPTISGDGRMVVFSSLATNLVAGDSNAVSDVFVRDRIAGTTVRVSVSSVGGQADRLSTTASLSRDGRFVSFVSSASNLVPSAPSSALYVRDLQALTTTLGGISFAETQGYLSVDGRYIAAGSPNAVVRDRFAGVTFAAPSSWLAPALSANGRYVVVLDNATRRLVVASNPL